MEHNVLGELFEDFEKARSCFRAYAFLPSLLVATRTHGPLGSPVLTGNFSAEKYELSGTCGTLEKTRAWFLMTELIFCQNFPTSRVVHHGSPDILVILQALSNLWPL